MIVALVLAIGVDALFALVNFYPVAPPRAPGPRREVLAELNPVQARWFQANVLDPFNAENNVDVRLRVVAEEDLLRAFADPAARARPLLAVLPSALADRAARQHEARPFDAVIPPAQVARDFDALPAEVMAGGRVAGRQWFIPRMAVLDVGVYRRSRVRDAERRWETVRPAIEAALRASNGRGLPVGYALEHDPARWDAYDQFVLGYYWAHAGDDGGPPRGRVAHRTGDGLDSWIDLAAGLYRAGGTDATLPHPDARSAQDFFAWEALSRQHGLYAPEMFAGTFDDEALLDAVGRGDVYLAAIDQMEAFTVHGGSHRGAEAQAVDPDDLGFVATPRFRSLALDAGGAPARSAEGFSFREESVWALPAGGPDPALAYALVRFAWTRDAHARECAALGMLPLRGDVLRERASLFRVPWMGEVFEAGFAQWPRSQRVPPALFDDGLGSTYVRLWARAVGEGTP